MEIMTTVVLSFSACLVFVYIKLSLHCPSSPDLYLSQNNGPVAFNQNKKSRTILTYQAQLSLSLFLRVFAVNIIDSLL